jgi:hypothetical protein
VQLPEKVSLDGRIPVGVPKPIVTSHEQDPNTRLARTAPRW